MISNHDAGAGSLTQFVPPITPEQVCRQFNELEGTSVGVFLFCCNIGGDVFLYPTNIAECCGANISDWNAVHKYYRNELRRAKGNLEALRKAGLDPIEIIQRRSRELGIQFWMTMRMNESHEGFFATVQHVHNFPKNCVSPHFVRGKGFLVRGVTGGCIPRLSPASSPFSAATWKCVSVT